MAKFFLFGIKSMIRTTLFIVVSLYSLAGFAQTNIFELMERTDLTLQQTEVWADNYFAIVGTGQGSGFKQYQRWLYERKFHIDENGYYIRPETEDDSYYEFALNAGARDRNSFSWTELGPNDWTYTSGWNPGVGRITSVAIHPNETAIIYVS